jgi:predicted amidohydrolase
MESLRLHYLQVNLQWEDFRANETHLSRLIEGIAGQTDLIILPEMFATGYSMRPDVIAQEMDGPAVEWMRTSASQTNAVVMGSLAIHADGKYYNRLVVADPDGSVSHYDKRHLFTFAGEHEVYSPGSHQLLVTVKGWKIMPLVCYDLRFPVWSRNTHNYDLLVYVANWPTPRKEAWTALLKARSIENQCYVVGVNRVGSDPNGNEYPGKSVVYDMAGRVLHESEEKEDTGMAVMCHDTLVEYRSRFAFLQDQDQFDILG